MTANSSFSMALLARAWFGFVPIITATLTVGLLAVSPAQAQQSGWSTTGSPATFRGAGHRAVVLANGKVLSLGGSLASPELYDPATGQWSQSGSLITGRSRPVAVRLANGKVLVAGGTGDTSAELYDPETGAWSATGSLSVARLTPAGVLLADGRVLITGGSPSPIAEAYDPATGAWSPAGTMTAIRSGGTVRPDAKEHTSTLLPDGRVLVVGGDSNGALRSAELYDPATGSWTVTGDLITPRFNHTATLLPNGKVLVAGGARSFGACPGLLNAELAELYDPATGQWSATSSLITPRAGHTATLLASGKVLVVGGNVQTSCNDPANSELYDPATESWSNIGSLPAVSIPAQTALLASGKVLAVGGARAALFDSGTDIFALPQFVFGGGWSTRIYFSNTTSTAASLQVNFFDDNSAPLNVPLTGAGSVTTLTISLDSGGAVMLEAPNVGDSVQGWAEATLPRGITGYAVFRQTVVGRPDQEAVVALTPENSRTADLTYDDILFTSAVAFLNPSAGSETVTIDTFDANGASTGITQVVLAPRSKMSNALKSISGLGAITGNRGRVVFSVSSGAVSVLGLRFGGSAFTSIPVVHRPAMVETRTISYALPQFVFGGAWYTAIYFSNTTNAPLSVPVSFVGDDGAPLNSPLAGVGSVTSQTVALDPGATAILEFPADSATTVAEGWVEATLPPGVTGYAVFRQTVAGRPDQEAVVPLTSESSQAADLIYDDLLFTTAVAFLNPGDQQTTITITAHSANGAQLGSAQLALPPHSKVSNLLKNLPGLSSIAGNRGWASFSVPNGAVSGLGLRFGGSAFTSIPISRK